MSGFKSSGFKTSGFKTSGLQNVRLKNVRFQNVWFQNVWFQNVQFLNFIYLWNKKYRNCQICIAIESKECVITTYYGDIWQNNPLKQRIKHSHHFACKHGCNRAYGFPPTTSTEHIWMLFCNQTFWRPHVLWTWHFVKLTFCKADVSDVL